MPEPVPFGVAKEWTGPATAGWTITMKPHGQVSALALMAGWRRRGRAGVSVWWTTGGHDFPARMAACSGLPPARLFTAMLTGVFDGAGVEDAA